MANAINIQRSSEVYMSTVDLSNAGVAANMTPSNTWRVEVLAGYAASQAAATQDITTLESGLSPDRSTLRFNTAINPTEWSFQTYVRPTGVASTATGNSMPVSDWFLWQTLLSNTNFAVGVGATSATQSAWQNAGAFDLAQRAATANVAAHTSNFAVASQNHLYIKMDNIVYQVKDATVNEASIDAALDGIATTSWSGFGTNFVELTGAARDNFISVSGGVLNSGVIAVANASNNVNTTASTYKSWANFNGVVSQFIKNRLSSIEITHRVAGAPAANTYTFPVTGLGFTYSNSLTYLTPEELAALNEPIGQFTGSKTITGNFTAYLRAGNNETAQFLRNIVTDTRTSISSASTANLRIGGATAPSFSIEMPAVQLNFPTHSIEDVVAISVEFLAQETNATKGTGSEIKLKVLG